MTNVGCDSLLKFGKLTLSSYSIVKYQKLCSFQPIQLDRLDYSSPIPSCYNITQKSDRPSFKVLGVQKRHLSENTGKLSGQGEDHHENTNHSEEQDGYSSSSSPHYRQYNRQSYERRRTHYENDSRDQMNSNAKTSSLDGTHYQRLNIEQDADLDTIKSAYYSLSKVYHPDIVGSADKQAVENFRLITESYDTLSDPQLKADYDSQLKQNLNNVVADVKGSSRRPGHRSNDFDVIYRMRDTEMFFRAKQDAAMRREKILNPKKFRAGSFSKSDDSPQEQLARLERRMERLNSFNFGKKYNSQDGSEFYRQHLYNTMMWQKEDLQMHARYVKDNHNSGKEADLPSVLVALGALPAFIIAVLLFTNYDFASDIDDFFDPKGSKDRED